MCDRRVSLRPLQAVYHAGLASAAAFCGDLDSAHSQHFKRVMGEAVVLLIVVMECLPEDFLACQSISLLDGTSKMPPEAFEKLTVRFCMASGHQVHA